MTRGYIYLISFKDTNDIYIGKTINNIKNRFKEHKKNKFCVVNNYVTTNLNDNWDDVYIDIIDSVDINEDLTHLINHPLNIDMKYTKYENNLARYKLHITERYYIRSYEEEDKYKLINKQRLKYHTDYIDTYKFFQYS